MTVLEMILLAIGLVGLVMHPFFANTEVGGEVTRLALMFGLVGLLVIAGRQVLQS